MVCNAPYLTEKQEQSISKVGQVGLVMSFMCVPAPWIQKILYFCSYGIKFYLCVWVLFLYCMCVHHIHSVP